MKKLWMYTLSVLCGTAGMGFSDIIPFTESFSGGPGAIGSPWLANGEVAGHIGLNGTGQYELTDTTGGGSPTLFRDIAFSGSQGSFTAEIEVDLPAYTGGTDFKWKMFGPDGFMEVVVNNFGAIRMFHGGNAENGNLFNDTIPPFGAGNLEGDSLDLRLRYYEGTDSVDLSYSLNDAASVSLYAGGGFTNGTTDTDDSIGDVITNNVQFQVLKFGAVDQDDPLVRIDRWDLSVGAIPEPRTPGLIGIGIGILLLVGRRRYTA